MAPSRIVRRLHEEVRRPIDRIACGIERVEQTAARARCVDEEVRREVASADGSLRSFNRGSHGILAEVLDHAKTVGALPSPANDVLQVDLQRESLLAVGDTLLALSHQAPHLAARD